MTEEQAYMRGWADGLAGKPKRNPCRTYPSGHPKVREGALTSQAWGRGYERGIAERDLGLGWPNTPDQRYVRPAYRYTFVSWPVPRLSARRRAAFMAASK